MMQHVIIFSSFHCKKDNRRDLLLASYFKEYVSSVSRKVLNCGQHKQTNKQTKNIRKVFFSFEARQSQNKRFYSAPPLPYNLLLLFRPFSSTSKLFQPFFVALRKCRKIFASHFRSCLCQYYQLLPGHFNGFFSIDLEPSQCDIK